MAAQGVLATLPINTQPYTAVTRFYTFAQNILLNHPTSIDTTKQSQHSLRSTSSTVTTNGTNKDSSSPTVPTVRPPLREALYTMGPNGPLFTSIASREITPLIAPKLPTAITLPTSTGGTFTASATSIVPTNLHNNVNNNNGSHVVTRTIADVSRERRTFERRRGDFSDDRFGKLQATKWLDWGGQLWWAFICAEENDPFSVV